jgi:hypothetical protein
MWITLTESDIQTGLTGPELTAAKTAVLASGQTGVLDEVLEQVTREVRGHVATCRDNTLGPAGTIPDELKGAAIDECVYRLCKRLPGKILLKQERTDAHKDAIALFARAAECKFTITQPDVASDEITASPPPPRWTTRAREFDRASQDGV